MKMCLMVLPPFVASVSCSYFVFSFFDCFFVCIGLCIITRIHVFFLFFPSLPHPASSSFSIAPNTSSTTLRTSLLILSSPQHTFRHTNRHVAKHHAHNPPSLPPSLPQQHHHPPHQPSSNSRWYSSKVRKTVANAYTISLLFLSSSAKLARNPLVLVKPGVREGGREGSVGGTPRHVESTIPSKIE